MRRIHVMIASLTLAGALACSQQPSQEAKHDAATAPEQPQAPATAPAPSPESQPAAAPPAAGSSVQPPAKTAGQPAAARTPAAKAPPGSKAVAPGADSGAAQSAADQTPPPPPAPRFKTLVLPAGTGITVRLTQALSSGKNRQGEHFEAVLDKDLTDDGQVVAPRGSTVGGHLTQVDPSGRVKGRARMTLTLDQIEVHGDSIPVKTSSVAVEADPSKKRDAAKVGGGAGLGAIIGAIAGGGKGAAIGAAIGGAAGGATVLATRGKEVELDAEQKMEFELRSEVRRTVQESPRSGGASRSARASDGDPAAAQARIERKVKTFHARMPVWVRNGGDASRVQPIMDEFKRLADAGQPVEAEAKLDEALAIIQK